jgi:diaminopropionate ammonia-lyase
MLIGVDPWSVWIRVDPWPTIRRVRSFVNPRALRDKRHRGLFNDGEYSDVREYFAARPELQPTPLRSAARLADALGVAAIDVKDESGRFGLSAFKILGVTFALHRLQSEGIVIRALVCATAGNHGRAVARAARQLSAIGVPCTVFVPSAGELTDVERATRESRIAGMRQDGAEVVEFPGSYEEAVQAARAHARTVGGIFFSDTAPGGWEPIPNWIVAGYTHMFEECSMQWARPPDVVLVQAGVGGLACAAGSWFRHRFHGGGPYLIACEPDNAACLLESARTRDGGPVTIAGDTSTIMAGLRCATPSRTAWAGVRTTVDAFVTVPDSLVLDAMERLGREEPSIEAGPSGACGVASLIALANAPEMEAVRSASRLDRSSRVLVVITEGP